MLQNPANPDLIFTWGNPSRGDDALGPALYELLQQENLNGVDLLTDFQLQIEHSIDLEGRKRVLFVDASTSANAPFELTRLQPEQDTSYTTHAMSPSAARVLEKIAQNLLDARRLFLDAIQPPHPPQMLRVQMLPNVLSEQIQVQANRAQGVLDLVGKPRDHQRPLLAVIVGMIRCPVHARIIATPPRHVKVSCLVLGISACIFASGRQDRMKTEADSPVCVHRQVGNNHSPVRAEGWIL